MFHRSLFTGIQIDFIFGQNFKDGPQLYPPLDFWNTVSERERKDKWKEERDNKLKIVKIFQYGGSFLTTEITLKGFVIFN